MVDPIVGSVVAKAAANAIKNDVNQISPGLLKSVLGPPAHEFGQALGRLVAYRTRNLGKIIEKADARLQSENHAGSVNLRVAFSLLDEGSLCDDELMAEYLGGLLAGSKSPDGRDDRAVTWTRTVTSLSSFQIRAHYLLYRELAIRLQQKAPELDLSYKKKMKKASMTLYRDEFDSALRTVSSGSSEDAEAILRHSIFGLCRTGLLHDTWTYNKSYFTVRPTGRGMELYGWALGVPDLMPCNFISRAFNVDISPEMPRLTLVHFFKLPKPKVDDECDKDARLRARQIHPSRAASRTIIDD